MNLQPVKALKRISFELRRSECLGLIGKTGAEKTTLLKMLNGLIKPDQGSITMHGRVGALIALKAGVTRLIFPEQNTKYRGLTPTPPTSILIHARLPESEMLKCTA